MIGPIRGFAFIIGLAAASSPVTAKDGTAAATRADIAAVLGAESVMLDVLPEIGMAAAWSQYRAWYIDHESTIPQKYRALIGLAVSSQIPCSYCIYADTSDARVFGASDEEIKEAVAMAAMTRHWSAILNGMQVDMDAWRTEIDAGAEAMREALSSDRNPPNPPQ
jgi:AhpD family alkylhydroperoxidase